MPPFFNFCSRAVSTSLVGGADDETWLDDEASGAEVVEVETTAKAKAESADDMATGAG